MFWFKRKEIVVDCFTTLRGVYELYKPDISVKFFPNEVKLLPNLYDQIDETTKITYKSATIRKCNGLIDYYKTGFILPMWSEFICEPKNATEKKTAIGMMALPFDYNSHDRKQYTGLFENYIHIKLSSPWLLREKTGVKFSWNSPIWNLHKHTRNFTVVPAVVSYDYQCQTNVNIFIDRNSENFTIIPGTPLAHIVPLSENRIVLKHHLIDDNEYSKIGIPNDFSTLRPERYSRWIKESKQHEKKCPFGFGK